MVLDFAKPTKEEKLLDELEEKQNIIEDLLMENYLLRKEIKEKLKRN